MRGSREFRSREARETYGRGSGGVGDPRRTGAGCDVRGSGRGGLVDEGRRPSVESFDGGGDPRRTEGGK